MENLLITLWVVLHRIILNTQFLRVQELRWAGHRDGELSELGE